MSMHYKEFPNYFINPYFINKLTILSSSILSEYLGKAYNICFYANKNTLEVD